MKTKIRIVILLLTLAVLALIEGFFFISHNCFQDTWNAYKSKYRRDKEYAMMHAREVEIANLPSVGNPGYDYRIIRHSGGGISGKVYSNSLEAWDESYQSGCRIFDADLTFTTDSVLVLRHAWEDNLEQADEPMSHSRIWTDRNGSLRYAMHTYQAMDYQTFISTPIYKRLTPMTCDDMLRYMHAHSDLYVAADMKAEVVKSYKWLVARAENLGLAHVLDRIIVSCYTFDDYYRIMSVYSFNEIMIRQFFSHPHNYYRLVEFCCKNNIPVVNLSYCYKDDEGVKVLASKGIRVYIAVEDDWNDFNQCRENGIYGCVSNYLKEENN